MFETSALLLVKSKQNIFGSNIF